MGTRTRNKGTPTSEREGGGGGDAPWQSTADPGRPTQMDVPKGPVEITHGRTFS